MVAFSRKEKYFVGMLVSALVVSVGLNLYNCIIVIPQIQATANNMTVEALKDWVIEIGRAKYVLSGAQTNVDVEKARFYLMGYTV